MMNKHHERRRKFYSNIDNFWADLYGQEYALYDLKRICRQEAEKIRLITERVGKVYSKAAALLRNVPYETFIEMGYPQETLSFLRLKTLPVESVIARLDLIPFGDGYKCIEINSDTPTFIKELFCINGDICKEFGVENPNEGLEEQLYKAIQESIHQSSMGKYSHIVFTAHEDNLEDRETVKYLKHAVPLSKFTPLHKLQIKKGIGLFDENDVKIDILYRQTFPIENVIMDQDKEGNPIGLWLIELVEEKKLTILNPPSSFLLQNKAVQAVIWGLHEDHHPFFTEQEHRWIDDYFLPTYLEPDPFLERGVSYVKKPVFGREGDTVEIYSEEGQLMHADNQKSYTEYTSIYQMFIEQPKVNFQSENGFQNGYLLLGSFLLNGKPSAFGYRVGGIITDNLSYYLPVGINEQ